MGAKRQLEFTDRHMFNRVVCQEKVCRGLIRALLGIEVGSITYLNAEQPYEPGTESRGVRMDVVAKGDGRVYDIEMQVGSETRLGRRLRYYQAAMDVGELGPGAGWELLPESHIVFICPHDLLKRGEPVYTFDRICREVPDLGLEDASHWHILNASAWEDVTDAGMRAVLKYVRTGNATDELSRQIDGLVARYNDDRKWVSRVMLWEEDTKWRCRQAKEEGRAEGRAEGENRLAALVTALVQAGRPDDVERAADDPAYRERLFHEFEL